jgi:hypothetical protein
LIVRIITFFNQLKFWLNHEVLIQTYISSKYYNLEPRVISLIPVFPAFFYEEMKLNEIQVPLRLLWIYSNYTHVYVKDTPWNTFGLRGQRLYRNQTQKQLVFI